MFSIWSMFVGVASAIRVQDTVSNVTPVPMTAAEWQRRGYTDTTTCLAEAWAENYNRQGMKFYPSIRPGPNTVSKYESVADTTAREAFWAKMQLCKGGVYMWGFGSLLNAFTIPQLPTDLYPYTIAGLERGWASDLNPDLSEGRFLAVHADPYMKVTGAYSSHAKYLSENPAVSERCEWKQRWTESIWAREVTAAGLVMEWIYVPDHLKEHMDGQRVFKFGKNLPPSPALKDVCVYTNVARAKLYPARAGARLLQTYVDTVLIGALAMGGNRFVEQTILTTSYWPEHWQNDRLAPHYRRAPWDMFERYNAETPTKTPRRADGSLYRFAWTICLDDMAALHGGSEAEEICGVVAVCDDRQLGMNGTTWRREGSVLPFCGTASDELRDSWLHRVNEYVDKKLAQASIDWFVKNSRVDDRGETQVVYMQPTAADVAKQPVENTDWKSLETDPKRSLLAVRKEQAAYPRLCLEGEPEAPISRNADNQDARPCKEQGMNGVSFRKQRGLV